jgi:hypothetical protein
MVCLLVHRGTDFRVSHNLRRVSAANYRLVTHFKFSIVGPDQNMVTKRP